MSRVKELKGKEFGISADYPKVIIDRRKKKMHLLKKAKKQELADAFTFIPEDLSLSNFKNSRFKNTAIRCLLETSQDQ